jgi:pimeloyl-ACP methyl ester carboxylesterase
MLPEAFQLGRRGAVSILIDAPWMRPGAKELKTDEENLASWLQDVVDIRRAVDALVDHYGAPPAHLGYVGHSYGATMGGLLTAGERRFRALVLMGGFASLSDAIRHPKRGEAGDAHSAQVMSAIDAERYIGYAAPAALLFQFAQFDRFITAEQANRYAAAASSPKQVKWYECGHEFNDVQSATDRENWLTQQLVLRK